MAKVYVDGVYWNVCVYSGIEKPICRHQATSRKAHKLWSIRICMCVCVCECEWMDFVI